MGQVVFLPDRAGVRHVSNPRRSPTQQRILLAYSGRGAREYLAAFLASRGYRVTACGNGAEALAHLAAHPFELVVTGILMPRLDGLELVRALRRRRGPPAIMVSEGAGMMDFIYLRNATLWGAVATHTFAEAGTGLLESVDWILRGRDAVIREVVW